jgi:hypothetical protein
MSAAAFHHPVQAFRGTGAVRCFTGAPDHCPACGERGEPRPLVAHSTSPDDLLVDFVFQCPRATCRRFFVAEYAFEGGRFELLCAAAPAFDPVFSAHGGVPSFH